MVTAARQQVLSTSTMSGDQVQNAQGEDLGKIEDFMMDLNRGCISYAVLSFGGFLGMGDKLFAVPWDALEIDLDRRTFILDVPKERLENAPGFDKDNWPTHADDEFLGRVYDYYGIRRTY